MPTPRPTVVVVGGTSAYTREMEYYISLDDSEPSSQINSQTNSGSTGNPPYTTVQSRAAWYVSTFVPVNSYDDDIESQCQTQPATVVGRQEGARTAYVQTGYPHGGLPSGGPPANDSGYMITERNRNSVHNRGEQLIDGEIQDLGPAYGTDGRHSEECRRQTRSSVFQNTCFCEPKQPSPGSD